MKQIIKSNIKRDLLKFLWIPIILIILSSIIIFQFKKDEQNSKHSLYFGKKNDVSEYFERRSIEIFKDVWSKLDFNDKNLDILVSMFTRNTRSIFTELEFEKSSKILMKYLNDQQFSQNLHKKTELIDNKLMEIHNRNVEKSKFPYSLIPRFRSIIFFKNNISIFEKNILYFKL